MFPLISSVLVGFFLTFGEQMSLCKNHQEFPLGGATALSHPPEGSAKGRALTTVSGPQYELQTHERTWFMKNWYMA